MLLEDDGSATVHTLLRLLGEFRSDGGADTNGEAWHANLADVFEDGLPVRWVHYEQDDLNTSVLWNIAKHDEANNK